MAKNFQAQLDELLRYAAAAAAIAADLERACFHLPDLAPRARECREYGELLSIVSGELQALIVKRR